MATPTTPEWQTRIDGLHAEARRLRDDLEAEPLEQRLPALALLERTFAGLCDAALRQAAADARAAGWGLRRIGRASGRSHEQIRILTAPVPLP